MPAKPVEILSCTPSSTDTMTTSANTPSMRRVNVRSERSLCAHSSIKPPVMTSQTRASRAPSDLRRGRAGPSDVAAWRGRAISFIAQRLHRRLPAGLGGGVESEEETEHQGHQRGPDEA